MERERMERKIEKRKGGVRAWEEEEEGVIRD